MMSENYNDFRRVFLKYGLYHKAISYMASKILDASTDICGLSRYHNNRANDDADYIKGLHDELEHEAEDYIYFSKYARGINPSVTIAIEAEIEDALGNLPSDKDRERYICTILRDLHEGYSVVEELHSSMYKVLMYCVGNCLDNKDAEDDSEDEIIIFAHLANGAYWSFTNGLFAICLKYGINLEYLQDKYELRIMHEWSKSVVVRLVGGEKTYKVLCSELEHPLREDKRLTKSQLTNIWEQINGAYIKGSEKVFIQMYNDTTFESRPNKLLEWVAKPSRNNGIAKGALVEFLVMLGKSDKEIQKTFEIYFGIEWHSSYKRGKHSQHYDKLKETILREE